MMQELGAERRARSRNKSEKQNEKARSRTREGELRACGCRSSTELKVFDVGGGWILTSPAFATVVAQKAESDGESTNEQKQAEQASLLALEEGRGDQHVSAPMNLVHPMLRSRYVFRAGALRGSGRSGVKFQHPRLLVIPDKWWSGTWETPHDAPDSRTHDELPIGTHVQCQCWYKMPSEPVSCRHRPQIS